MRQPSYRYASTHGGGPLMVLTRRTTASLLQRRRTAPHVDTSDQSSPGPLQVEIMTTAARTAFLTSPSFDEYRRTPRSRSCIPTRFPNLTILSLNSTASPLLPHSHILCPITPLDASFFITLSRNKQLPFSTPTSQNTREVYLRIPSFRVSKLWHSLIYSLRIRIVFLPVFSSSCFMYQTHTTSQMYA